MIEASEPPYAPAEAPGITRDRVLAACGVASMILLGAAFIWAHHWGPVADAIVAAWAITTLVAGIGSYRDLSKMRNVTRLTTLAFALAAISVVAFLFVGAAAALGADPTGSCGGG